MDERFDRAPVGILEVTTTGTVRAVNERASRLLAVDPETAAGSDIDSVFPASVEASVPRAFETPPEETQTVEEYYPDLDQWFEVSLVPGEDCVALYLQDVTDQYQQEKAAERRQEDLARLTVINELISDILAALVDASTREEIAETICTRLGETELYDFAWLGERELGGEDIVVRAASGTTGRTLDRIEDALETGETVPEARAIETGTPEIVQPVGDDEAVPEAVRRAAFADGLQSLLAVPLTYGSSVYGVVGLYTSEREAFSERERGSFGTVGEMAGFAVNATRHRTLLLSDTVVELRLRITDPADPLVAAAGDHDAALTVDGLVPQGDAPLCYLTVEGETAATVSASLADAEGIRDTRVVGGNTESGPVEVALATETPLGRLLARGTSVRSASFDSTGGTVTVDLSPEEDVRRLADSVTRGFDAEVVAKRQRDEDIRTPEAFRDRLGDRLTERQENALKTAFLADYFESPRGSTAQEVGEALDITGPTLLHHLRAGQRKLLAEFFDTDSTSRSN
jgi:predicted DNA binding protein